MRHGRTVEGDAAMTEPAGIDTIVTESGVAKVTLV